MNRLMIKPSIYEEKIQNLESKLETLRPVLDRLQTELSEVKRQRDGLQNRVERLESALDRQRQLAVLWHGKYTIVKMENNKLRRKVKKNPDAQ